TFATTRGVGARDRLLRLKVRAGDIRHAESSLRRTRTEERELESIRCIEHRHCGPDQLREVPGVGRLDHHKLENGRFLNGPRYLLRSMSSTALSSASTQLA